MHISAEGKIGIGLGLVALLGGGVLVVAPAPWVTVTGWVMVGLGVTGLLLLAAHHVVGYVKRRRAESRKAKGAPSSEELRDLYENMEAVRAKLLVDHAKYEASENKVSFDTFHEVFAVMVRLAKLKVPVPFVPEFKGVVQYKNFNSVMYRYFSAIAPLLRDGDLAIARRWASVVLKQALTNPPAAPLQAPEQQGTPEKT